MENNNNKIADYKVCVFADTAVISECLCRVGFSVVHIKDIVLDETEVKRKVEGCDAVVFQQPFTSELPFIFDRVCDDCGITVLYPFIFGWGVVLTILKSGQADRIDRISKDFNNFERIIANHVIEAGKYKGSPYNWFEHHLTECENSSTSAGDYLAAAMCANILCRIVRGETVRYFSKYYIASVEADD